MGYLDELNEIQRKAVEATDGPVMVIAGPGSGKTRVLTYRIAHLMDKGIDPFNVLALTFTNKAAREMRERIEKIVGNEARNLWMGTFHSIFAKILRIEADRIGYPNNFTIYDTQDSKNVIKQIVKEKNLNDKLYKPATVFYRISSAKNSLISPTAYLKNDYVMAEDASAGRPKLGELYLAYARKCFQSGAMDFDDLLYKMYELIAKHPDALYKYQQRFHYILVDEYQDTNYAQYLITKKLAAKNENICVVGDDAQSIYSFRGADIQNILNFEKDYPDMKTFKLEQNYRSSNHIVQAANEIITKNKLQLPKEIWTDNGEGDKIRVIKSLSDNDEGATVANNIFETKMNNQLMNEDFAILYRTNAQSRAFEEALRRKNIPYKVYGGLSFYQRKEVKDVVAYMKITINPKDEEALRRVINYPKRGIGNTTMDKLTLVANERDIPLWNVLENPGSAGISGRTKQLIEEFVIMIKSFASMLEKKNAYDLAVHIAKQSKLMSELYTDKTVEGISRYENLQELLNGIKEFSENDEVLEGLDEVPEDKGLGAYLQQISLLTDADDSKDKEDRVKMMTIHAAKGLEFEVVNVVGLEENLFPSQMSLSSREDLEEERRLFYVAVTRAKSKLNLSYALQRYRFGSLIYCEPSRFIDDLSEDIVEYVGHKTESPTSFQGDTENSPFFKRFQGRGQQTSQAPQAKREKTTTFKPAAKQSSHTPSKSFTPDDPYQLQTGMEVEHQKFGFGKVVSIEGEGTNKIATMFFKDIGQKRIMLKYAKISIVKDREVG